MRNKKKVNPLSIIGAVLRVLFTIFIICFVLVVCLQRFSKNEISVFNLRMFTVASGSMVPKYKIGDVLISKETDPSKIKIGDAVTYLGKSGDFKGKVVTHEVIQIEKDTDGKYLFHTKGIANLVEDPVVSQEQIYGVVVYKPIILSWLYGLISNKFAFYCLIIVPLIGIVVYEIVATLVEKEGERRAKNNLQED